MTNPKNKATQYSSDNYWAKDFSRDSIHLDCLLNGIAFVKAEYELVLDAIKTSDPRSQDYKLTQERGEYLRNFHATLLDILGDVPETVTQNKTIKTSSKSN